MDYSSEDERIERIHQNALRLDDPDEGFESSSNTMDTVNIINEWRYPMPQRPPFQMLDTSDEEEEEEAGSGGRRLYDRYPHTVKTVSRGDDDEDDLSYALRDHLMNTRTNGEGLPNVERATRITGMGVKGKKIIYFVMWDNDRTITYALDEHEKGLPGFGDRFPRKIVYKA